MGLVSVIPLFAPIALILGIAAVIHLKRNPKQRGMGRAVFAIVMGTIFSLVLLAVIVANVLAAL